MRGLITSFRPFSVFLTPIKIEQIKHNLSQCYFVVLFCGPTFEKMISAKQYYRLFYFPKPSRYTKNKLEFVHKLYLYFLKYLQNYIFTCILIFYLTLNKRVKLNTGVKSVIYETTISNKLNQFEVSQIYQENINKTLLKPFTTV